MNGLEKNQNFDENMKAKEEIAAKRVELHQRIPLAVPFSLQISPSNACNFKCSYCWQSLNQEILSRKGFNKGLMNFEVFKKTIDGLEQPGDKLKLILFAGLGEPLLNKDIVKMIAYAKQRNVAERIDILTNAALLTKEMSERLIDAGLDRLRISVQGLSSLKYKEVCGANIDFNSFVENIRYFHSIRKSTSMYIKIIDVALDEHETEKQYHEIFDSICDKADVEFVCPFTKEIDYSKYGVDFKGTMRNNGDFSGSKACPLPFYMIAVQVDGSVTPWCTSDIATVYGNINDKNLLEIWNGREVRDFQKLQLSGREQNAICRSCSVPDYNVRNGDSLNGYEQKLLKHYV